LRSLFSAGGAEHETIGIRCLAWWRNGYAGGRTDAAAHAPAGLDRSLGFLWGQRSDPPGDRAARGGGPIPAPDSPDAVSAAFLPAAISGRVLDHIAADAAAFNAGDGSWTLGGGHTLVHDPISL
jgi:hypothetical protein